jgi:carbamoyltransferase
MKVIGLWSGHDCSYCVLEDGVVIRHDELERFVREKEPKGDAIKFMMEQYPDWKSVKYFTTCYPTRHLEQYPDTLRILKEHIASVGGELRVIGHHNAHAANAFYSSKFEDAAVVTLDGGGVESSEYVTAMTCFSGSGTELNPVFSIPIQNFNIGGLWTRSTRYIFKLQSGYPLGHQAGVVMAMAALGDKEKYLSDFLKMLTVDIQAASMKPSTQPAGAYVKGYDPVHPYLDRWSRIADISDQDKYDLAASLQHATELVFRDLIKTVVEKTKCTKLCFSGGVTLNSVMLGKVRQWFPEIEDIYHVPVPHDGGLAIGAAQWLYHADTHHARVQEKNSSSPYLGKVYTDRMICEELASVVSKVAVTKVTDDDVVDELIAGNIVAVHGGGSESGRRALGNRSILADPRSATMRDTINKKVKHRQWYRPFAPSILREHVSEWFVEDIDSPYMSFVINFKPEKAKLVPAVVHIDGSARLQTVTEDDNAWYHGFITKFYEKTQVPILLNTSLNDREPVCETPRHSIDCFLRTNIDVLYFSDVGLLVRKK